MVASDHRASDAAPSTFAALVLLLAAYHGLTPLAIDLSLPAMPAMAAGLAVDGAEIKIALSALTLGLALGQLVYGPLSDRIGRRPAVFLGLGLYIATSIGCAFAASIEALTALRFVQGFAACAGTIIGRAVVRDRFGADIGARVLAHMMMIAGVIPVLAPILGGYLTLGIGWRAVFVVHALYGAMVLVSSWRYLEETRPADAYMRGVGRILTDYVEILREPRFRSHLLCGAFTYAGLFAFLTGSSAVIITYLDLGPDVFGFAFSGVMLATIAGGIASGRLVRRLGIVRTIGQGTGLGLAAGAVMTVLAWSEVAHLLAIVGPMFVYIFGLTFILPATTAGALAPFGHIAGSASSLLGFLQLGVGALTGVAVARLDDGTQLVMANAIGLSALAAFASYWFLVRGQGGRR